MSIDWLSMGATIIISIVGSSALTAWLNNRYLASKERKSEEKQLIFSYLRFLSLLQEYIGECLSYKTNNFIGLKDGYFNFRQTDTYHCCPPKPDDLLTLVDKDAPSELIHLVLELDRLHKQAKRDVHHIDDPDNVRFQSNDEAYGYFENLLSYAAYLAFDASKEIQKKYDLKNYLVGVNEKDLKNKYNLYVKQYLQ